MLYGFFVIGHGRRRILHFNASEHPTSEWIIQQLLGASPEDSAPRYLILDGDRKYEGEATERCDLAKSSHTTIISVGIESPALVPRNEVQKTLDPVALDLLRDLRSWIRFVTRQYWIGYREDFRDIQHYTISLVHGDQRDQLSTAGQGQGYDYFRRLNLKLWEIVAAKLAGNEKPRSGQLFFCDGLLHLMELNLRGAVIALAMACELEVFALIQDILDLKREAGSQNADDIEWRRFTEKLDDLERLCRSKFCEVGSEANRRVRELYRLRGKAAHRSR